MARVIRSNVSDLSGAVMGEVVDLFGQTLTAERPAGGYQAFSPSSSPEPEPRLFLIFRTEDYLILSYRDLESIGNPQGVDPNHEVLMRFGGSMPRDVRIEGRRLIDLVDYLWRQRIAWIKETPTSGFPFDGCTPIVSRIAVRRV
jgi:hypothetical protein